MCVIKKFHIILLSNVITFMALLYRNEINPGTDGSHPMRYIVKEELNR
jgi:hypothetical protein